MLSNTERRVEHLVFQNSSKKNAEKGKLPSTYYGATITLIQKADKDGSIKKSHSFFLVWYQGDGGLIVYAWE